jgi:hypothetical protein
MNHRTISTIALVFGAVTLFIWGCQSNRPVFPSKNLALTVYAPANNDVKSSLLGVASNEILYHVDGPGLSPSGAQTVGPFSTAANDGSIDFTANVPALDSMVLSIQLNDASTHQPLAVGAVGLDMISSPVTNVVVDMGSVTRTCYFVNEKPGLYGETASTYGFATDALVNQAEKISGLYDIGVSLDTAINQYQIIDAQGATAYPVRYSIAYLGNGNFVDHDRIPPNTSYFFTNSGAAKQYAMSVGLAPAAPTTDVQVGDIYYILLSSINNGQAWVQVTDPGFPSTISSGYGLSFRFRVNSTLPYFGYEQTTADQTNSCSPSW